MAMVDEVLERIRDAIHREVEHLPRDAYREVLEALETDMEGSLEALDEEDRDRGGGPTDGPR